MSILLFLVNIIFKGFKLMMERVMTEDHVFFRWWYAGMLIDRLLVVPHNTMGCRLPWCQSATMKVKDYDHQTKAYPNIYQFYTHTKPHHTQQDI